MASPSLQSDIKPIIKKNIKRELETDEDKEDTKVGIKKIKIEKDASSAYSSSPTPCSSSNGTAAAAAVNASSTKKTKVNNNKKSKNKKEHPVISNASKQLMSGWLTSSKVKPAVKKEKQEEDVIDDDVLFLEDIKASQESTENGHDATINNKTNPVLYPYGKKPKYGDFFERWIYKDGKIRFRCIKCTEQVNTPTKMTFHLKMMHRRAIAHLDKDQKIKNQKLYAKLSSIE